MKIKCGIIGLPNIGKSTLFNSITNSNIKNKNFPFCTITPNQKNINFNNIKIFNIYKIVKSKKITFPKIEYIDIAGLIKGASNGLGLGNKFLENIKNTHILIHVIRIFKNVKIININKNVNPIRDINIINNEIKLYDLNTLNKNIIKNKNNNEIKIIKKYIKNLNQNTKNIKKSKKLNKFNLLTYKKKIYLLNIDSIKKDFYLIKKTIKYLNKIENKPNIILINIKKLNTNYISKIDINKIKYNITNKIIKKLKLLTFYTANKKETKAWIIKKNKNNILEAAKKVHNDFKLKFIKAQIINYKEFIKYKKWNILKKKCKIKIKGKKYKIKNNDIIYFII